MPAKKLAIAVIHGMGEQRKDKVNDSAELTFSAVLRDKVRNEIGEDDFDAKIAWREIFWADVMQPRQNKYAAAMKKVARFSSIRAFVMYNLSDAACYIPSTDPDSTYTDVHKRVERTIADLEADVEPDAPLVILAHSLGGHIMSNYIYDLTKKIAAGARSGVSDFQNFRSFAGFVTFGCNIPVFLFSVKKIEAITFPGTVGKPRIKPWWSNFYDVDDPLGYPLIPIGGDYEALGTSGQLKDFQIDVGFILENLTPFSHNAYWRDRDFYRPVARALKGLLPQ